jgi:TolA-binding protein
MNRLLLLGPIALLSACSGFGGLLGDQPAPTLGDLDRVELPAGKEALPRVSLTEMADIYRDVLAGPQDPQTRLHVSHRLADIEMLSAEEELATAETAEGDFVEVIEAYETLLRDNPDYPYSDRLLYQLSKAYALDGRPDESLAVLQRLAATAPESPYLPEAWFRQAERRFVEADYVDAEALYANVIEFGEETPYFTRALYMQGWSRFKQDKYAGAVAAFSSSLDQMLPADIPVDSLSRAEQELVHDSLRIMSVMFSRQQGTDTIASAYDQLGVRPWEYLLYESLGELYLSQERYADSALAYQAYIERRPDSKRAHHFQMRVIETYEAGGFGELIVEAKQNYVEAFSVTGAYWLQSDEQAQQTMADHLKVFIPELARHHHALAQTARTENMREAASLYHRAAHYYQLYLDSFPEDPAASQLGFLLAESLYEAGDYLAAIDAYEMVAYDYRDPANAADAAYTAILAYEKLIAAEDGGELQRRRIESELHFQDTFPGDSRAPGVLGHAAGALLEQEDYPGALDAASTLVSLSPAPDTSLLIPAWLVIGHSRVALDDYTGAEDAYRQSLSLQPDEDTRNPATRENLAAAIYRQGEQAVERGEDTSAADQFQRAMAAAPASGISKNAQYDAAQALLRAGELEEANALLRDFRQRYPDDELSEGIGATLLANYEQTESWQEAAVELDRMRDAGEVEGDTTRQALIVAARYYEQAGDRSTAIARYRTYADGWPNPLDEHLEVINHLAVMYGDAGDDNERRYWLERTMAAHDGAGSAQSDRSRFLAASAATELADESFSTFSNLRLGQPIEQSLPAKKGAMEAALAGYQRCNRYAVEQFITRCTYRLGEVYQQFSQELMASERPAGLDALALEQYDIMLEEQAFPFEEKAIALHEANALRSREGVYDRWVKDSFLSLAELLPARYGKREAESIEDLKSAAEVSESRSRKVRAFNDDAIALRREGDFGAAEQAYLSALRAAEDDAVTHHNIGILYDLYMGEPDKAMHHYQRYQEITGGDDRGVAGWIADLNRRHTRVATEIM